MVIAILGLLVGLLVPRIIGREDEARVVKAKITIQGLETAVKLYRFDNSRYPTTQQGLQALVAPPQTSPRPRKWRSGGYLEKRRVPKDPWGNAFIYHSPGIHGDVDIISLGADGEPGGSGLDEDIGNWQIE